MTEKDFIRFVNAIQKYCNSTYSCDGCKFRNEENGCWTNLNSIRLQPQGFIEQCNKWCKEHPTKTYIQDFFEKFPDAYRCFNGKPEPCRNYIYFNGDFCSKDGECVKCWNEEMPE